MAKGKKPKEIFAVRNCGQGRGIPTYKGNFFLNKGFYFTTADKKLATELGKAHLVEVRSLKAFAGKTVKELRKMASESGVKRAFSMKKAALILALGG